MKAFDSLEVATCNILWNEVRGGAVVLDRDTRTSVDSAGQ